MSPATNGAVAALKANAIANVHARPTNENASGSLFEFEKQEIKKITIAETPRKI